MKNDLDYVHDILDAIAKIDGYVKNMTFKKFIRSHLAQDAVIRQVAVIREASRNLQVFESLIRKFLGQKLSEQEIF